MSYRSVMQNNEPYIGGALIGLYHTINEPFYYGGENAWQVDVDIDVDDALINVAGITSANIGILDVASFQSSYQVSGGVISGITSTNRLNLTFDPVTSLQYLLSDYTTVATANAGVGTNIIPAAISIGGTIGVGDLLVNGLIDIPITGIATTAVAGIGNTVVISLASSITSGISSGSILSFKKLTWVSTSWSNDEGGRQIDIDLADNMVVVGGIATEPIWNFKNYSSQNSRMATVSVVGISTRIIAGAGASDATYVPGNISAGSSFKINGQWVGGNIMWDGGSAPSFVDSQITLVTFKLLKDDIGNLYVLGSKTGPYF